LSRAAIAEIVTRFAAEMNAMGADVDVGQALKALETHYAAALAAE
jgi:alanine-glyoxylate transaminase/serine-glyoxylate transaminase/serine-pyruvate transaminase